MTKRTFNPSWASAIADTREARRLRKSAHDRRKREREQRINERLALQGLTLDEVIEGLDNGTIGVYIK